MLSNTVSVMALQYAFIFPAVIVLRRMYPHHRRPYKVPGGPVGIWLSVIVTEFVIISTSISLLWPGLIDDILGRSYDIKSSWGTSRIFFEVVTLGTLAAVIVMAVVFWWVGQRNVAKGIIGENDPLAIEGEVQPTPVPPSMPPGSGDPARETV